MADEREVRGPPARVTPRQGESRKQRMAPPSNLVRSSRDGLSTCAQCGHSTPGEPFVSAVSCLNCGTEFGSRPALSHEDQIAILNAAIKQYKEEGWYYDREGGTYGASLMRRTGILSREGMAVWVEDDGTLGTKIMGTAGLFGVRPA